MRTLMVGAGKVRRALGSGWAKCGHELFYAVPDPEAVKHRDLPRAQLIELRGSSRAAALSAELLELALPFDAAWDALATLGDLHV